MFADWLLQTILERDITQAELAKRSGLSEASISLVINGKRNAGADFCERVARVLNLPVDDVFRRAGLLPIVAMVDERDREVSEIMSKLDSNDKDEMLEYARLRIRVMIQKRNK